MKPESHSQGHSWHGPVEPLSQLAPLDGAPEHHYRPVPVADVTAAIDRLGADEADIHLRGNRDATARVTPRATSKLPLPSC